MFLISKLMFDAVYRKREFITIVNYDPQHHYRSFYYFRLGAKVQDGKADLKSTSVIVPKNGFVNIWSLESFNLSERVMGLFGGTSDLMLKGLQLVHSPAIDPGFTGALALGIRNLGGSDVEIHVGDQIGKLLLFDISDSVIETHEYLNTKEQEARLAERKAVGAVMGDAFDRTFKHLHKPD